MQLLLHEHMIPDLANIVEDYVHQERYDSVMDELVGGVRIHFEGGWRYLPNPAAAAAPTNPHCSAPVGSGCHLAPSP